MRARDILASAHLKSSKCRSGYDRQVAAPVKGNADQPQGHTLLVLRQDANCQRMRGARKAPLPESPEPSQADLREEHLYSLREASAQQRATCPHRHAASRSVRENEAQEAVKSGAKTSAGSQEEQVTARLPQGRGEEPGTPVEARNAAENVAKRQQVAQERCCPRQVAPTGPGSLCSARRRRQELFCGDELRILFSSGSRFPAGRARTTMDSPRRVCLRCGSFAARGPREPVPQEGGRAGSEIFLLAARGFKKLPQGRLPRLQNISNGSERASRKS